MSDHVILTYSTAPSSPPQNIKVLSDDPASLKVSWQPPLERDCNGAITGYVIQYTRVGIFESDDKMILNVSNVTMLTISGLIANDKYKVTVAAVNKNGTGPFSKPVFETSGEDSELTYDTAQRQCREYSKLTHTVRMFSTHLLLKLSVCNIEL